MDVVAMRRENTLWSIRQNPSTITITRTTRTVADGGFTESTAVLSPITVRIFKKGTAGQPKETSNLSGEGIKDPEWGLIADYQADIKAGTNVSDVFTAPGLGTFAVTSVNPQRYDGQIVAYQADLELMT